MVKLRLIPEELPVIATIIEGTGRGLFSAKIKRYLKQVIDATSQDKDGLFPIEIDDWVAIWLLSTLYASETDGAASKLMFGIEDAMDHPLMVINAD